VTRRGCDVATLQGEHDVPRYMVRDVVAVATLHEALNHEVDDCHDCRDVANVAVLHDADTS